MRHAVHIIAALDPAAGGPSVCVPELAEAVNHTHRYRTALIEFFHPANSVVPFAALPNAADLLHVHGIWQLHCLAAAFAARRSRKPLMISAHGMLERWALNNKKWKKRFYAALVENRNLRGACCLHALSPAELDDYRRFGLSNPVAVIPNGVDPPPVTSPEPFLERFPELDGKRLVTFLGRIHYKKGLDVLCQAWQEVARREPEAHLVLAGADWERTESKIRALVARLGIADRVTFTGPIYGGLKWSALAASSLFVLPSHSEGFSVAVLEAMASRLPVIITPRCNFPDVVNHACGWIVEPEASALAATLSEALRLPANILAMLGGNGAALVARRYTWARIGEQMASTYDWMLGGGPAPECVVCQ